MPSEASACVKFDTASQPEACWPFASLSGLYYLKVFSQIMYFVQEVVAQFRFLVS
jgi:hypothetical protein